ncbi:hypothetical protein Tco_1204008 [Tanacetum coccineum]
MDKSSQTLRFLTNEQGLYRDNTRKSGLGYKDPYFLKEVVVCNPKLYHGTFLCDENVHAFVYDSEEILDEAENNSFRKEFSKEVKEMYDSFQSMERELEEMLHKNDNKEFDRLLEATLAHDVRNFVVHCFVEIENENLREENERISKEAPDVKEELSKRTSQFEKDFAKLEAQSISFELEQHKMIQENNSLTSVRKENENFLASLQTEMPI